MTFHNKTQRQPVLAAVASHIRDRADLPVILIPWMPLGTKKLLKYYLHVVYVEADLPVTQWYNLLQLLLSS